MCNNNVAIFKGKDLIAVRCSHDMTNLFTPVYIQFSKNPVYLNRHDPHIPTHSTNASQ